MESELTDPLDPISNWERDEEVEQLDSQWTPLPKKFKQYHHDPDFARRNARDAKLASLGPDFASQELAAYRDAGFIDLAAFHRHQAEAAQAAANQAATDQAATDQAEANQAATDQAAADQAAADQAAADQAAAQAEEIPEYIKIEEEDLEFLACGWTNNPNAMSFATYFNRNPRMLPPLSIQAGNEKCHRKLTSSQSSEVPNIGESFDMPNLIPVLVNNDHGCLGDTYILNDYGTLNFYVWNEVEAGQLGALRISPEIDTSGDFQHNFQIQLEYVVEHAHHTHHIARPARASL